MGLFDRLFGKQKEESVETRKESPEEMVEPKIDTIELVESTEIEEKVGVDNKQVFKNTTPENSSDISEQVVLETEVSGIPNQEDSNVPTSIQEVVEENSQDGNVLFEEAKIENIQEQEDIDQLEEMSDTGLEIKKQASIQDSDETSKAGSKTADFMAEYYARKAQLQESIDKGEDVAVTEQGEKNEIPVVESVTSPVQESREEKYNRSLQKTRTGFSARLNAFLANFRRVDEEFFEELEELLILSDVGVTVATQLTEALRYEAKLENAKKTEALKRLIIEKLVDIYEKDGVYNEVINFQDDLTVMLFVGVNGVGKTTSIGKLAHKYKTEGKKVMLVAADTFRAGAVAQLVEWGRRVAVPVVTGEEKADPASVVFDGMECALAENVDILLIDTAGRLQNKQNLMAELEKIGRIIKRVLPDAPHETLLALDASTGQNALSQAKEFSKITPLTGLVLTKIDGTAKGGVVLAIRQELDIPVKFIGFGEKIDDIGTFNSEDFMRGLLEGVM